MPVSRKCDCGSPQSDRDFAGETGNLGVRVGYLGSLGGSSVMAMILQRQKQGWRDGSAHKVTLCKPKDPSSRPRAHVTKAGHSEDMLGLGS